ncbi:MAG: YraN family protein [Comamonadaceae bacterium]|nr:YraN family protein [Comamonadaceae bacterium]
MSDRGSAAEQLAADYLAARGLRVVARNYRGARRRGGPRSARTAARWCSWRFDCARDDRFGGAGASITAAKRRRLILAARHYLAGKAETPCRFDAVLLDRLDARHIEWIRDAFAAD